ncbi:MAG: tripartite tricarboxylate transporter substrate-binding protein, partial [Reyranella sp.]|nr:tripartite tricarboxylate transporter substrate-binding protein [Reyranella sp.]
MTNKTIARMIGRRSLIAGAVAVPLAAPMLARHGWAQSTYPNKQVRVVVPFAPGGTTDLLGRIASAHLQEVWGQTFVVDNKSGAGGNVGAEIVAKSPADGYTLL